MDSTPSERDFVLIAANPRSGSQSRLRHLEELADWLRNRGLTVEMVWELERAEQLAGQLFDKGRLRALVSAGGDGTLAELMNRTPVGLPLAAYPAGTANLIARYVGASSQCEQFGQMLLDVATVQFDAGCANGRLFLAVCSCGFDAEVVRQLHARRSGHITALTYALPILSAVGSYSFPELRIHVFGQSEETGQKSVAGRWAFVSNLPCYAGGLQPGVGACGTDGLLDLCAFESGGLWPALRYLPHLWRGTQGNLRDCATARAARFRIESVSEVPYELDGDPGGILPVDIHTVPRRLTLIVPSQFEKSQLSRSLDAKRA